jgi:1,4-alpha-glucan branching enzyme
MDVLSLYLLVNLAVIPPQLHPPTLLTVVHPAVRKELAISAFTPARGMLAVDNGESESSWIQKLWQSFLGIFGGSSEDEETAQPGEAIPPDLTAAETPPTEDLTPEAEPFPVTENPPSIEIEPQPTEEEFTLPESDQEEASAEPEADVVESAESVTSEETTSAAQDIESAAVSTEQDPEVVEEPVGIVAVPPAAEALTSYSPPKPIWVTEPIQGFDPEAAAIQVSPDALQLHLASLDALEREPKLDPASFQPHVGPRFNADGSLTLRVLVGNTTERLALIGDFNNWGTEGDLSDYTLQPTADDPHVHSITLPPGDYHKAQYRLLDSNGHQRLDMGATLYSTPAFNRRFYEDRNSRDLNAVFWKPTPIPAEEVAERPDLRGQPLAIAEADMVSLAMGWTCTNPQSDLYGSKGAEHISELYRFTAECGLPEKLADLGYNTVQFMPLDTHVDFYDPNVDEYPDWRYSYETLNYYGKHADFGSPDELKRMVNAFHKANLAVIIDAPYSHFAAAGNNPPREFGPYGYSQYHQEGGGELYGGPWTEWGTRRFYYTDEIRRNLIDAALINLLDYGFDGLRIDNVNGVDYELGGREFLRELAQAVLLYRPRAVLIGEGYFGDPYLNRSVTVGGAGLDTTYSDRFYLWFTEQILKHRDEVDMWALNDMLTNDWARTLLYYPSNHDEFANAGNPFQTRGRYLADAIDGGDVHNRKIQSWSALALFASSYYLDMPQMWTLQSGNLNTNAVIDWQRLSLPQVEPMARLQADMKGFFASEPSFGPQNTHRNMVQWIDDVNKVVVFKRLDFDLYRHVYVVVNLGDQAISDYTISARPEDATFSLAVDSDRSTYGGGDHNPSFLKSQDRQLRFYLGSYGVVALRQEDKLGPFELDTSPIQVKYPDVRDYSSPLGFSGLGSFRYPGFSSQPED